MSVRIELDKEHGTPYTNLDWITGKVILNIPSDETISSITIKLEGLTRTRLEPTPPSLDAPDRPRDTTKPSKRAEIELHRILYIVQTVWPPENLLTAESQQSQKGFTIKPGEYDYPFKIRIPINSSCTSGSGVPGGGGLLGGLGAVTMGGKLEWGERGMEIVKESVDHVKGTLPPSLSGVPGEMAMVKYFLKATVNRPSLFKTNLRCLDPFVLLPIEPPRPIPTPGKETFAKRKHEFLTAASSSSTPASAKKSIWSSLLPSSKKPASADPSTFTPTPARILFSLEARLPSPPILVPNDPLPLRLLLTKLEPFTSGLTMRSLQISLVVNTFLRAHDLQKEEHELINLVSVADLHFPLLPQGQAGPEIEIDSALWRGKSIPDTVPPTFKTCNISRNYQLQVNVGVSRAEEDHTDVISLLLPLQVYSGIKPPDRLVEHTMSVHRANSRAAGKRPAPKLLVPPPLPQRPGSASGSPISPALPPRTPTSESTSGALTGNGFPNEKAGASASYQPSHRMPTRKPVPGQQGQNFGDSKSVPGSPSALQMPVTLQRPSSSHNLSPGPSSPLPPGGWPQESSTTQGGVYQIGGASRSATNLPSNTIGANSVGLEFDDINSEFGDYNGGGRGGMGVDEMAIQEGEAPPAYEEAIIDELPSVEGESRGGGRREFRQDGGYWRAEEPIERR